MNYVKDHKWSLCAGLAIAILFGFAWFGQGARAADLGGECCADLEERIAELELTTPVKGNSKVKMYVYGHVNQAVVWTDTDDSTDWSAGSNSNSSTFLGVRGEVAVSDDIAVKYVLQVGLDGYEEGLTGFGHMEGDTHGIYLRRNYITLESATIGGITVGKASQATDGISQIDVSKSYVASVPLTFRPLTGPGFGEVTEIFDGTRANVLRYDSPVLNGFWFSGSVAAANVNPVTGATDGNVWDIAARYYKNVGDWKLALGLGYRRGIWIEDDAAFGVPISIAIEDEPTVYSGSASVMHTKSGLFANATYGNMDLFGTEVTGYAGKLGIELGADTLAADGKGMSVTKGLGSTTVFVEYGSWDITALTSDKLDYWGAGVVQGVGPMNLYLSGRQYDLLGTDTMAVTVGMSMDF